MLAREYSVADDAAKERGLGFLDAKEGEIIGVYQIGDTATAGDGFERAGKDGRSVWVGPHVGFLQLGLWKLSGGLVCGNCKFRSRFLHQTFWLVGLKAQGAIQGITPIRSSLLERLKCLERGSANWKSRY